MKDTCKKCGYWLKKPSNKYKCYCGDCPAKKRDTTNPINEEEKLIISLIADNLKEISRLKKQNLFYKNMYLRKVKIN